MLQGLDDIFILKKVMVMTSLIPIFFFLKINHKYYHKSLKQWHLQITLYSNTGIKVISPLKEIFHSKLTRVMA